MSIARKALVFICLAGAACFLLTGCPESVKYPACEGDTDCHTGEKCVNQQCVSCSTDSECGAGSTCVAGACQKAANFCSGIAECPKGEVCVNNLCTACQTNDQCGTGSVCVAGICQAGKSCVKDDDCAEDEDCVNSVCQKGGSVRVTTKPPTCTPEAVYFGFDQYSLSDESHRTLQKDFECMQANKERTIRVVGMTDPRGTVEYNIGLSDDRAQSVITYLSRLGVDPSRMHKVPKGKEEAHGTDEQGWSHDRRVEFVWE
jgi:peptidoglycan-associated lipoprotein